MKILSHANAKNTQKGLMISNFLLLFVVFKDTMAVKELTEGNKPSVSCVCVVLCGIMCVFVCVCVCVRACVRGVRACVRACVVVVLVLILPVNVTALKHGWAMNHDWL